MAFLPSRRFSNGAAGDPQFLNLGIAEVRYCASLIAKLQTYRERVAPHCSPPESSASSGGKNWIMKNRSWESTGHVYQWYINGINDFGLLYRCVEIMFNPDYGSRLGAWNWCADQTWAKPDGIWIWTKDALRSAQNIPSFSNTSHTSGTYTYIMYIYIYVHTCKFKYMCI